jgi:hypothetical protein
MRPASPEGVAKLKESIAGIEINTGESIIVAQVEDGEDDESESDDEQ